MQRDKTEGRKSELKSESCRVLSRQSVARGGREEVPRHRRGSVGTMRRAAGRQQCFLSSKRADNIASTAPAETSSYFYTSLVLAAVLLKAFCPLQPSKCPCCSMRSISRVPESPAVLVGCRGPGSPAGVSAPDASWGCVGRAQARAAREGAPRSGDRATAPLRSLFIPLLPPQTATFLI